MPLGPDGKPAAVSTEKIFVEGRTDARRQASEDKPLLPIVQPGDALGIRSGTPLSVKLKQAVDSAHARNGDLVQGTLASPVAGLPVGTPVQLTVVLAIRAGMMMSYGELSLQVISVADRRVLSEIVSAQGKEGPKEVPDAAPGLGTEAGFQADQIVTLPAA